MRLFYLLLLLSLYLPASGRNYYVNAKSGDSEFSGLSPSLPKRFIQDAANLTKPGDTVFVMNGTYTNECPTCNVVEVPNSGSRLRKIVYTNYPGHHPIIRFNGWAGFSVRSKSFITIRGFEIIGNNAKVKLSQALRQPQSCANRKGALDPRYNGNGIAVGEKSHHIVISTNIIHDCGGGGIGVNHSDFVTVEDNVVYNTSLYSVFGNSGISFYQFWNSTSDTGYRNVIRRNKTYNNRSLVPWKNSCLYEDGNGIIIDDFRHKQNGSKMGAYKGRTLIENNISWYNGGTGIHSFQSDHVDIVNNTAFCNSQGKGLKAGQILSGAGDDIKIINNILVSNGSIVINTNYSNTNITYENNLHYNIDKPGKEIVRITSSSTLEGKNPLFRKASHSLSADFRLQKGSPAIDGGHRIFFSNSDFFGLRRPFSRGADIGAIEGLAD